MANKKSIANEIKIQLGQLTLNSKQQQKLQKGIHAVLVKVLSAPTKDPAPVLNGKTATLHVVFTGTIPGNSELTANFNGTEQTLTESGDLVFEGLITGSIISITGSSPGTTIVTIDIKADPASMTFAPGQDINGLFIILE